MSLGHRNYTNEEHALMVQMWAEGKTMREIADSIGRTLGGVDSHVKAHRADFPRRKLKTSQEERDEMRALRKRGWSYERIAAYLGVSDVTVRNHAFDGRTMTCAVTLATKTED